MERVRRIELPYAAWEAAVLPLNYTRMRANRSLDLTLRRALMSVIFDESAHGYQAEQHIDFERDDIDVEA